MKTFAARFFLGIFLVLGLSVELETSANSANDHFLKCSERANYCHSLKCKGNRRVCDRMCEDWFRTCMNLEGSK